MKRSNEPIAWSLFGAGGMLLAFFGPGLIVVSGVLLALAFADRPAEVYSGVLQWLSHPLGKLLMLAVVALSLYHSCHRLYHATHDLHLKAPAGLMLTLFYGCATVLSILTAGMLWSIG